jgi:ribosome-associated protein
MELSRSEQKRRIKQLGKLVVELVGLPTGVLKKLPVTEEVRELVQETRGLKGGARKRQIKYITKLLRSEPVETLYDFLAERKGGELFRKKQFHELEYLRDILIEEAIAARRQAQEEQRDLTEQWQSKVVEEIVGELPAIDDRELSRLAFLFAMTRNKKHSREIFRMLQAAGEQREMNRKFQKP